MNMTETTPLSFTLLQIAAYMFVCFIGFLLLAIIIAYVIDTTQTKSTLRRNYPVIARFRYFFEHLGVFFRQYFFAMDREELPFNRAERSWVYRASKKSTNTVSFGSTKDLRIPGAIYFSNCLFPALSHDNHAPDVILGPYTANPYAATSIVNISAMSFGALSEPAIKALSLGAKKGGCWLNTGEGGLSPHHLHGGGDIIFQIGTAKFGVRTKDGKLSDEKLREIAAHPEVKMFEVKLSQGAKPGKGGILPAAKVTEEIAAIRGIEVGKDAISPNRFPEIDSIATLLDFIHHVRSVTGKPTGFKLVIGSADWVDELCTEIHKRGIESAPDFITLDSGTGGTGAAPMSLIDNMGMPIRESLPLLVDKLIKHNVRDRIKVIAAGKLINPSEIAWALCTGADFINSARGFMFSLGCIQAMQCGRNTCPTGITTHKKRLQKGLDITEKSERVKNYLISLHKEINIIAHSCGVDHPRQLTRDHARIVTQRNGVSQSMEELHPTPEKK